jgi:lactoylglutathione lyase
MKVKLDHVNITVRDLDESIKWYREIFGFEKAEGGNSQLGKRWAIVACEDSMIAMTEYKEKKLAGQDDDRSTHRIFHFGLRVPSAENWRAQVKKYDLTLYYGGEIEYPFSRSWYVHDPSGHEIEVSCADGKPLRFPDWT